VCVFLCVCVCVLYIIRSYYFIVSFNDGMQFNYSRVL